MSGDNDLLKQCQDELAEAQRQASEWERKYTALREKYDALCSALRQPEIGEDRKTPEPYRGWSFSPRRTSAGKTVYNLQRAVPVHMREKVGRRRLSVYVGGFSGNWKEKADAAVRKWAWVFEAPRPDVCGTEKKKISYEDLKRIAVDLDDPGLIPLTVFAEKLRCSVSEVQACVSDNEQRIPQEDAGIRFYYAVHEAREKAA